MIRNEREYLVIRLRLCGMKEGLERMLQHTPKEEDTEAYNKRLEMFKSNITEMEQRVKEYEEIESFKITEMLGEDKDEEKNKQS